MAGLRELNGRCEEHLAASIAMKEEGHGGSDTRQAESDSQCIRVIYQTSPLDQSAQQPLLPRTRAKWRGKTPKKSNHDEHVVWFPKIVCDLVHSGTATSKSPSLHSAGHNGPTENASSEILEAASRKRGKEYHGGQLTVLEHAALADSQIATASRTRTGSLCNAIATRCTTKSG